VGLQLTGPAGRTWTLQPQFGDLTHAEGGFTTPLGTFEASWSLTSGGGYTLSWTFPEVTSGTIVLPAATDQQPSIIMDGIIPLQAGQYDASSGVFTIMGQSGGSHSVEVIY
jgi:hypothetical protein